MGRRGPPDPVGEDGGRRPTASAWSNAGSGPVGDRSTTPNDEGTGIGAGLGAGRAAAAGADLPPPARPGATNEGASGRELEATAFSINELLAVPKRATSKS
jgi:hypothetical protein